MRLKLIACKLLFREICLAVSKSNNYIDATFLAQHYHNTPEQLNKILQNEINKIDANDDLYTNELSSYKNDFDAILLGYGLCSNAVVGLCSKKYRLVVPKAHDCITLLLGSKEKYKNYFEMNKGIYWYTKGWIECTPMPSEERYKNCLLDYTEKYGEENAEFLMEMEQGWFLEYKRCTFINQNDFDNEKDILYTKECAKYLNWEYDELCGDLSLLNNLINGNWNENDFLVVPPNNKISPSFDNEILKYE